MGIREIIGQNKEQILATAAIYEVFNVRIFGSVASQIIPLPQPFDPAQAKSGDG